MMRLAILGSTRGTNMLALIEAIEQQVLPAQIELVISNKKDALILQRAKAYGLRTEYVNPEGFSRQAYDEKLSNLLMANEVDLVVLIGYMRILSQKFVAQWQRRVINVHPSLLPAFAGKMDLQVHQAVLDAGNKETGCTVHYVTSELDAGPIILQKKCSVLPTDTIDSLKEKVQQIEGVALIEAIQYLAAEDNPLV